MSGKTVEDYAMPVGIMTHDDCLLHQIDTYHPERPQRLQAIKDRLIASGLDSVLREFEAPLATREQLLRVHHPDYVESIFALAPQQGTVMLNADTGMNPHTLPAALRAAGGAAAAVDRVMAGEVKTLFCNLRPPGHHAERGQAMGFCLFDNVAIAVMQAIAVHGLDRVAVIDFDVHHGNGTEDIFQDEERVLFLSSFQHPFYPYSDPESREPNIIKMPLAAGSRGSDCCTRIEAEWLARLDRFAPQLIVCSAGFDAHRDDPLGQLRWTEQDYQWLTTEIKRMADRHAGGRVVSCLEGGYDLDALGRCVTTHIDALLG